MYLLSFEVSLSMSPDCLGADYKHCLLYTSDAADEEHS